MFKVTPDLSVSLGVVDFKSLPREVSLKLIANFTKDEVKQAVCQCEGSKSPGPDGFNFNFIKNNWDILKDIMDVVLCFQESGCIPKGCNASFITLVPKVKDPNTLDQFRPISLVGALYKIITKALSCRMKDVLPLVIDENQLVFLK